MKKRKVLLFSVIAALSTSLATVGFASEGDVLEQQKEEIKAIESYQPSVKGLDLKHPETWELKQSTDIQVPIENLEKVTTEQASTLSSSPNKTFTGGKGFTYVVEEGLYYEGAHSTVPTDLTPVVIVNGWLGKQTPSAEEITWVDNQDDTKLAHS